MGVDRWGHDAAASATPSSIEEALLSALSASDRDVREQAIVTAARVADPEDLVRAVADQDNSVRRNAAIEALTRAGRRGIPTVLRALSHDDPEVVMFAASILGKARDAGVVPHLLRLVNNEDINISQSAIESLAQLRSPDAVDALVASLPRDPWIRFASIHALGAIGDGRAVPFLVPLLADESANLATMEALGQIGTPAALDALAAQLRRVKDDVGFLACLRAISDVILYYPDPSKLHNIASWASLAASDAVDIHLRLMTVLAADEGDSTEGDLETKRAAVEVVRALRLKPLFGTILRLGRATELRDVVAFCAFSAGADVAPMLPPALAHNSAFVRCLACRCAGTLGDKAVARNVEPLLQDPVDEVRAAAVDALGRLGDDRTVPVLLPLLSEPSYLVRDSVRLALTRMDAAVVSRALLARPPEGPDARLAALSIMADNPHPSQRWFIQALLQDADPVVRLSSVRALAARAGDDAVDSLAQLRADPSLDVRREVVYLLGRSKSRRARSILLDQVRDDAETRGDALTFLAAARDPGLVPTLVSLLGREFPAARLAGLEALIALGEEATDPLLVMALDDADATVRRTALAAVARHGSRDTRRRAAAAARDPDPTVRAAAADRLSAKEGGESRAALERLAFDLDPSVAATARRRLDAETEGRSGYVAMEPSVVLR